MLDIVHMQMLPFRQFIFVILKLVFCNMSVIYAIHSDCRSCPAHQVDYNQCRANSPPLCIDFANFQGNAYRKSSTKKFERINHEKAKSFTVVTSKNVLVEDLQNLALKNATISVENKQQIVLEFSRLPNLVLTITLFNINLRPVFEDVTHLGDNDIILRSLSGSRFHHLKSAFSKIVKNECRYPIPNYYYITMNEYPHRYTTAVKIICANQKYPHNQFYCPDDHFDGQMYYFRTVNDRCSNNIASNLPFEKNSFYCTQNTQLITDIFKYTITEKATSSQSSMCDFYFRKCQNCVRSSLKMCLESERKHQTCCASDCYKSLNCLAFYTSRCFDSKLENRISAHQICMKGNTLKFTLLPKFSLENDSFLCHVRRKRNSKQKFHMSMKLEIKDTIQTYWSSDETFHEIEINNSQPFILKNIISLRYSDNLRLDDDMYLKGHFNSESNAMKYQLYRKKHKHEFIRRPLKINRHIDSRYLSIQNGSPFYFNSENWYNMSCKLNVSDLFPVQDIYHQEYQDVNVIHLRKPNLDETKKSFQYALESSFGHPKINLEILNTSIIPIFLCTKESGRLVFSSQKDETFAPRLASIQWPNKWSVHFKGFVSTVPTFVNIELSETSTGTILFRQDEVVYKISFDSNTEGILKNSYSFHNTFFFDSQNQSDKVPSHFSFKLTVKDCQKQYTFKLFHFPNRQPDFINRTQTFPFSNVTEMNFLILSNKVTIVTFSVGIIYISLVIILFIVAVARNLSNKRSQADLQRKINAQKKNKMPHRISCKKKLFMFIYVAFRVFYTFLFTLSVGLSLLLGMDSLKNDNVGNKYRYLGWIKEEGKQLNQLSLNEVKRQFQYSSKMKHVCENQDEFKIKNLKLELESGINGVIEQWFSWKERSLINASMLFIDEGVKKLEKKLERISTKLEFNLINRFNDRYGQYQQLIKQYYYLAFLSIVQKTNNDSFQYSNYNDNGFRNFSFIQNYLVDFFEFCEIFEPKALSLYPVQHSKSLKNRFDLMTENEFLMKNHLKVKSTKLKKDQSYIVSHRMFDSRYRNYAYKSLVFQAENDQFSENSTKDIHTFLSFKVLHTRMFLMVLDCFIVIYRFYNTFEILKWIWIGKKEFILENCPNKLTNKKLPERIVENKNYGINDFSGKHSFSHSMDNVPNRLFYPNIITNYTVIKDNPTFSYYCKSQKYLHCFTQTHFIVTIMVLGVLVALLAFIIVTNHWSIKHYNPDVFKESLMSFETLQKLVNKRSLKLSKYVNKHMLKDAKIHNMNMSGLIINNSYLLSHVQKSICQQMNWMIKSIRNRSNTHSASPPDICRLQSDTNFLPHLLVHISPCQFLNVLPINYSLSPVLYDKSIYNKETVSRVNHFVFLLSYIILSVTASIGSLHLLFQLTLKAVLQTDSHSSRYVILTPFYPHSVSVKIHSSSSRSTQSGRNINVNESNSLIKCPTLPTVAAAKFNEFPTLLQFQLAATSESDV